MEPPQKHIARRTTTHINAQGQFVKRLPSIYQVQQASGTLHDGRDKERSLSDALPKVREQQVSVAMRSGSTSGMQPAKTAPPDVSFSMTSRSRSDLADQGDLLGDLRQPSDLTTVRSLPLQLGHDITTTDTNSDTEQVVGRDVDIDEQVGPQRTDTMILLEKKSMAEVAAALRQMYMQDRSS